VMRLHAAGGFSVQDIEAICKDLAIEQSIKIGEVQMIFRVMLVGSKIGPGVFVIAEVIGRDETVRRIEKAIQAFDAAT